MAQSMMEWLEQEATIGSEPGAADQSAGLVIWGCHHLTVSARTCRLLGWAVLAGVLAWTSSPHAAAAPVAAPELVGFLALAAEPEVADQLGLTEGQRQRLLEVIESRESEALELAAELKKLPPSERAAKLVPFRQASEAKGLDALALSKQQRARLQQIRVARWGTAGALDGELAERLKLTPQQQGQIAELIREQSQQLARADEKTASSVLAETNRKVAATLNPEQNAALQTLVPSAPLEAPNGGPSPSPAREEPPKEPATPPKSVEPKAAETKSTETKPVEPKAAEVPPAEPKAPESKPPEAKPSEAKPPEAKPPEAKPPESKPAELKPGEPGSGSGRPGELGPPGMGFGPPGMDMWGGMPGRDRGPSAPPSPPGPGAKPVAASDQLTPAKPSDRLKFNFRYQPWKDVLDWFAETAGFSLIAEFTPKGTFNYTDTREYTASEAIDVLNSVLLNKGNLLIRRGRMLVLVNLEDGIRPDMVEEIPLEELDKRGQYEIVKVVVQLHTITPEEAEQEVRKLLGPQGSVVVLPKAKQVVVTEMASRLRLIRGAIMAIEKPETTASGDSPQLEVYPIVDADPNTAIQVLQTLLAGQPELRMSLDPKTGNLIVQARRAQHATIKATLEQLQRDARRSEVFQLRTLDTQVAVAALKTLFGETGPGAAKIDADPYSRQLLVRGTEAQIAQIRAMLQQLGEQVSGDGKLGGTMRVVPVPSGAARWSLDRVQEIWPSVRGNRIRVVTPSSGISSVRPSASPESPQDGEPRFDQPRPTSFPENAPGPGASGRQERPREAPGRPPEKPPTGTAPPNPAASPSAPGHKSAMRPVGPHVRFASQLAAAEPASPPTAPAKAETTPAEPAKTPVASAPVKPGPTESTLPKKAPDIVVAPGSGGMILASPDQQALDELERLLTTLAGNFLSGKPELTVFYLKHAKAASLAETLDQILGGGTITGGSGGGGRSLMGDLAGAALGDVGGGLVSTLLDAGGGGAAGVKTSGSISITADSRLNALFVLAKPADLDTIEQVLKILDQKESPEDILASPKPQMIPVYNTQAQEVAEVVRQVYQDRMTTPSNSQRPPSPQDFINALRGGRGGSRGSQRGTTEEPTKMSIGVDSRTNSLVVAAPDALFREVKELVEQLDQAAVDTAQTMQVVTLQRTSPQAVRQALSAMVGSSVQFGSTGSSTTTGRSSDSTSPFGYRRGGFSSMFGGPGGFGGFPGGPFGGMGGFSGPGGGPGGGMGFGGPGGSGMGFGGPGGGGMGFGGRPSFGGSSGGMTPSFGGGRSSGAPGSSSSGGGRSRGGGSRGR